jgi:hypothetical protein
MTGPGEASLPVREPKVCRELRTWRDPNSRDAMSLIPEQHSVGPTWSARWVLASARSSRSWSRCRSLAFAQDLQPVNGIAAYIQNFMTGRLATSLAVIAVAVSDTSSGPLARGSR